MKNSIGAFLLAAVLLFGCACGKHDASAPNDLGSATTSERKTEDHTMSDRPSGIRLSVDGQVLSVQWESNPSVQALSALLAEGHLTLNMHPYGGFEQVGELPVSIENHDVKMTAVPGDIMLYAGNSIVIFWGTNTWAYTKLGHIEGMTADALGALLEKEGITAEVSLCN